MAAVIALPEDALKSVRLQAQELFEKLGLPTKEDEAFRFFPVRVFQDLEFAEKQEVALEEIEPYLLPECENRIVFVDGYYCPELSKSCALPLADAMRTYGHFLRTRFTKQLELEKDPFTLLNLAQHPAGAFLYLLPKSVHAPLQVLFYSKQPKASLPRLQVFAGAHSSADIVVTQAYGADALSVPSFDFALEEGANVRISQVADVKNASLSSVRATLKKAARFSHLQWNRGPGIGRSDIRVWLQGEEASADLKGAWMLNEKAQAHANIRVDHEAPHTHSMQLFKGVLAGLSQSCFEGKIYVRPEAQKTQAYQLNKNLLLNPHVIAHAKPNLEIFADDVKASHGATVAHLDDELLFYLKSRGIAASQAKRLLVEGFCLEVLGGFTLPSLAKEAAHAIDNYLG